MKKTLRVGGILLLALILIGAAFAILKRPEGPASAEGTPLTAPVTRGSIEATVSATGNVGAEKQATLAFASSGEVAEVLVQEGQAVQAGEVLARLDPAPLEQQVARSQASLHTAQARLAQAQKPPSKEELTSAQAALDSVLANMDSVKEGPSQEELASAQAALDSATANYEQVLAGPMPDDLASARAALESARAAVQQAQASYDRIRDRPNAAMMPEALTLQNATIELERAQASYDTLANHPTQSETASAWAQVTQAEASLAQLQKQPTASEIAAAAAQVAQAEATLAQLHERPNPEEVAVQQAQVEEAAIALAQAESQREDALLTAPFDGVVIAVQIAAGEWASPGAPAIVLAGANSMILDVNVDEADIAALAEGQPASLSFDAIKGAEIGGTVTHIAPASTNIGGAVAYAVEIRFDPAELPVRLGMTANVEIVVARAADTLLAPNRAIEADREAGRYYVTRQTAGGAVERQEVNIGLRDAASTQILDGVEEGDLLVLPEVPQGQSTNEGFAPPGAGGGMLRGLGNGG